MYFCTRKHIMTLMVFHLIWTLYLQIKQLIKLTKECAKPKTLEEISDEKYSNTRLYAITKTKVEIVLSVYIMLFHLIELYHGFYEKYYTLFIPKRKFSEYFLCVYWYFILNTIYIFVNLPVLMINTYINDQYLKNAQQVSVENATYNVTKFIVEQFFSLSSSVVVNLLIMNTTKHLLLCMWLTVIAVTVFFMIVHNEFVTPWYIKYRAMPEGRLKADLVELATKMKFPLNQVYIAEGQHEQYKYVEYLGLFNRKNLVIYEDVFVNDKLRNRDIIALAAHEIGHWYHNHYYKLFAFLTVYYYVLYLPLTYVIYCPSFYAALGFQSNYKPLFIGFTGAVTYIITPLNEFGTFFLNTMKRKFQYDADALVVKLGLYESLTQALYKLNVNETVCCVYDSVFSCWYMEHPTMQERLFMIDKEKHRITKEVQQCTALSCN